MILDPETNVVDVDLLRLMTSSNGSIFRVTGHLFGEFTGPRWIPPQKPVTRSFDAFCDLCLNKRLSKQLWGYRFKTLSCPLWRHYNGYILSEALVIIASSDDVCSTKTRNYQNQCCRIANRIPRNEVYWSLNKSAIISFCKIHLRRQNGRHLEDGIFKFLFCMKMVVIWFKFYWYVFLGCNK